MNSSSIKSLAIGLLLAATATATLAANTVSLSEKVDLDASPDKAWDAIKDFQGWQSWHPAFAGTELVKGKANAKGSVRLLTAKDGAKFTEELVTYGAASHTYTYRIIESPAPVEGYVSTLQVKARKGGSTVVWSSSFKVKPGTPPAEAKKAITGIYRAGLDNLAATVK